MKYFGQKWDAPIVDDAEVTPTPIGDYCSLCGEAIIEGDQGFMIPHYVDNSFVEKPNHRECLARSVTGGIEHLTAPPDHRVGTCYDGSTLTYRESSLRAWDFLHHTTRTLH